MKDDLVAWVADRIDRDTELDDEVGVLILAALEGEIQFDAYLRSGTAPESAVHPASRHEKVASQGVFLRSIHIQAFRGIGDGATLHLEPTPGLTVVAGRNGSGKSSFAEGLEVLLTGDTYRWKNKASKQWADQWRNIHDDGPPEVVVEMVEENSGPLTMATRWEAGATDVSSHVTTVQKTTQGTKGRVQDAGDLGWSTPLETFRPLLSYDELGAMLTSGPSELYDAISKVLGTEQLADALSRITALRKEVSAPGTDATRTRKALHAEVADLDDERAQAVAPLLKKTSPDTARIRELATGVTTPDEGLVASLRALVNVEGPDAARVASAAQRLRSAVEAMADAGAAEASRRVSRLELRRAALTLHSEHGEQTCPVCTQGTLHDAWADTSRDWVAQEDAALRELSDARAEVDAARSDLVNHMRNRPRPLDSSPAPELDASVTAARTAWDEFGSPPTGDLALADHLELHGEEVGSTLAQARVAASAALAERDDVWSPVASRISTWCAMWDSWLSQKPTVDLLSAAEKWLKDHDTALKNERLRPISDAAKHAWGLLRQESNVDLGDLRLEGQTTRRRVAISATIDGADTGSALPVMSQGELHALTLALFLPRATLDDSPFRFVVLDDPVQAMDPSKVDGLAALLTNIAKERQVVVFSHDDRLPAALRRADAAARILEVVRGPSSAVHVEEVADPALRHIRDADALCRDEKVPPETLRRIVPGLLRMAIEAAARDRFYAARLGRGESLGAVERLWSDNPATRNRVSLALFDEVTSLDGWLRTESRKKGLGVATSGFHQGLSGTDPRDAVHHGRRVVYEIKDASR